MTDIQLVNSLQEDAVDFLLEETFEHINSIMHEQYKELGRRNAELCHKFETRFIYNGVIYPPNDIRTIPYGSKLPALHYSLLSELDTINRTIAQSDYHYIKNFFIAAVGQSHNAIVLDELLPSVLVSALKLRFNRTSYNILDTGICGNLQQEPISTTRANIEKIKSHYADTISMLKNLLMDKLLLQK